MHGYEYQALLILQLIDFGSNWQITRSRSPIAQALDSRVIWVGYDRLGEQFRVDESSVAGVLTWGKHRRVNSVEGVALHIGQNV